MFPASPISGPVEEHLGGTVVLTETGTLTIARPDAVSLEAAAQGKVDLTGCPHCGGRSLQRWGQVSGLQRYRCGDCRRGFNALTGTPSARLRMKDRWQAQTEAVVTGESLAKTAKRRGIASTTAFRWRHRFLSAPALDKPSQLTGIVEAGETFILESFKGKRAGLPRPARKRGGKAGKRGLSAEQIPVLVARDRSGAATDAVLAKLDRAPSRPHSMAWSRRTINFVAMAARRSSASPAKRKSRAVSYRSPAARDRRRRTCISTTSMDTTAG